MLSVKGLEVDMLHILGRGIWYAREFIKECLQNVRMNKESYEESKQEEKGGDED